MVPGSTIETSATPRPVAHPDAPAPGRHLGEHHVDCFACGTGVDGLHLDIVAGEDLTLTAVFEVTTEHQGAPGLVHGGLVAAVFDEVMGALQVFLQEPAVTASLTTRYRRPIPVGTRLHVTSRLDRREGRKLWVSATGRLGAADGPLAAEAEALFIVVPQEHFEAGRRAEVDAARAEPGLRPVNP